MNFKAQGSIIMLMTSAWLRNQNKNIFLCLNPECLFAYLIGCCWHEFQGFCGNKHLEPIMPPPWWHHQNKDIFVYLNVDCICFFDKLLLTCISRVLQNHPWHLWAYNHTEAYCVLTSSELRYLSFLNIDCFFLFHGLMLKWTSKFLWKQPYMSLQLGWCLLRNDMIKVGKFLFVWTLLIASI